MSRRAWKRVESSADEIGPVRAYLRRFFTSWVAEDPEPTYSSLDLEDGLGQPRDPVCRPRTPVPESPEVAGHARPVVRVGGRAGS